MKKLLALTLVAAMLASMAIGCGPKDEETKAPETKAPQTSEADDETEPVDDGTLKLTDEEMTIELWDIASEDPNKTIQENAVKAFMEDYPNIKVNITHIANDTYKQKLLIAMSGEACPNAYIHWTGGPMNEYYQSGFCDDIGALYEEYNEVPYLESAISMCRANDGTLIALPYGGMSAAKVYYNKEVFDKYDVEIPTTMDELDAVCAKLKENGITPFVLANGSKWTGSLYYMYVAARYGGPEAVAKAFSGEGSFTDEPFVKAAEKIQEWVELGYFPEGVNSITTDEGMDRQLFYSGKYGMFVHLSSAAGNIKREAPEWFETNLGAFPFPIDEESQKAGIAQDVAVGSSVGNVFSFNCGGDEEMLKACFVLVNKYYTSDEYNDAMLQQNNKIVSIEGMDQFITDPVTQVTWDIFANASLVQLFYDQYLPASVGEVHKDTMSGLFGLTSTPEALCQELQDSLEEYKESLK